eukprot:728178-Rhodomonas_salina.1
MLSPIQSSLIQNESVRAKKSFSIEEAVVGFLHFSRGLPLEVLPERGQLSLLGDTACASRLLAARGVQRLHVVDDMVANKAMAPAVRAFRHGKPIPPTVTATTQSV